MRVCATALTVLLACASGCGESGGSHQGSGGSSSSKASGSGSGGSAGARTQASSGGSQGSGGSSSSSTSHSSAGASGGSSSSDPSSTSGGSSATSSGGSGGSRGGSQSAGSTGGSGGTSSGRSGDSTQSSGGVSSSASSGGRTQTSGGTGGSTSSSGGSGGSSQSSGGSTGLSTSDPNVVAIVVDSGPTGSTYVNGPFVTVTLCEPGSSTNCQNIDHVLIDTGSIGLRVLASTVKVKLPAATNNTGKNLAECLPFLSGTAWGEVRMADIKIGGEIAPDMRVHLIGETTYPLPRNCTGTPINDSESLSSNGILGIGLDVEDCGESCNRKTGNPGVYYECSSTAAGGCAVAAVPPANQLVNPITAFPTDNNGSFLQFPSIPAGGVASQAGYLVFGIGTRANNQLGNAKIIPVDQYGELETTYNGTKYTSFIDSGSNGYYFLSSAASKIPSCTSGPFTGFYCPQNNMDLTATMAGKSGSVSVSFTIGNASKLSTRNSAFAELGGPMFDAMSDPSMPAFDWGFPFHFGRTVFCAIGGKSTPAGNGPYFAF